MESGREKRGEESAMGLRGQADLADDVRTGFEWSECIEFLDIHHRKGSNDEPEDLCF